MFRVSAGDVLVQTFMVIKVLGPIYALLFGLLAVRLLIDMLMGKIFPQPAKSKSKAKRPRQRVRFDRKEYPGLRYYRTKKGLTVSWYDDSKGKSGRKRRAK